MRNVGTVTNCLFRRNIRAGLEAPPKGTIQQGPNDMVLFVVGGKGVMPLLAQPHELNLARIQIS